MSHKKPRARGPLQHGKVDVFQTNTEIWSVINCMWLNVWGFSIGWQECLSSGLQWNCSTPHYLWPPQHVLCWCDVQKMKGYLKLLLLSHLQEGPHLLQQCRQLWMNHSIPRITDKPCHVGNPQHRSCQNDAVTKEADVIPGCRIPSVGVKRWYYSNIKGIVCLVLVPTLEKNDVDNLSFAKEQ